MYRALSLSVSIVLTAFALACGSSDGASPSQQARADCERLCTLQMACGVADCGASCSSSAAGASASCADALRAYVDCYDAAECPTTGDGIPLECLAQLGALQSACVADGGGP